MSAYKDFDWAVVVVNWNNWPDTLECLEATLGMEDFEYPVILVDNASTDDSVERFLQWANGDLCIIPESKNVTLRALSNPPIEKPLSITYLDSRHLHQLHVLGKNSNNFFLIASHENNGFAAGNNIGIRFAIDFLGCNMFWLINNDAVPQRDAFKHLKKAFETANHPAICGTAIIDYFAPEKIQSCGGIFNFFTGLSSHKFDGYDLGYLNQQPDIVFSTYPVGASLIFHKDFIASAGLMDETLFLYYEELAWIIRKGAPYQSPIATRCRVFHKGSSSTGFSQNLRDRNADADYYIIRNRLLIGHQVGISKLIIFLMATGVGLFKRLMSGRLILVSGGFKAMIDGILGRHGKR